LGGKHGAGAHVALNLLSEVNLEMLLQRLDEVAKHETSANGQP